MTPEDWIAHDPDPEAVAELSACTSDELAARFSRAADVRHRGAARPDAGRSDRDERRRGAARHVGVARVLKDGCLGGSTVFVGYDARHGSRRFAVATAEVLAAEGFSVQLLPEPLPTPVLAFAVRQTGAAAGMQITASHNPASDNGYKVYLDGGMQIVSPTDREIETAMAVGALRRSD